MTACSLGVLICTKDTEYEYAKEYDKYIVNHNILNKSLNFPEDYPNYDNRKIKLMYEELENNIIKLIKNNNNDLSVLIDKENYDKIKYYNYIIAADGYVVLTLNNELIRLHRFLMNEIL